MLRRFCILLALSLLLLAGAHPAAAQVETTEDVIANLRGQIILALAKRDVDQLEKMAATFRTTRSRAPNGYWHHHYFHRIINELPAGREGRMEKIEGWEELVAQWKSRYPKSPTPAVVLASRYAAEAWAARGSGYAHQVWDSAWKTYRDYLQKARRTLQSARKIAQSDPEWFARMAQTELMLGADKATFMAVVEEGIKREPTYYKTANVAFIYLLPKWHGSAEEAEAWARNVSERLRATEGDSVYARIYAMHVRGEDARNVIRQYPVDWPRMKRAIDELLLRYPEPELAFALIGLSCAAKDGEQVAAIWKALGAKFEQFRYEKIEPAVTCRWEPPQQVQAAPAPRREPEPQPEVSPTPRPGMSPPPYSPTGIPRGGPAAYIYN